MQKNNKGYGIQSMADEFRKGIYTEDELAGSFGRLSSPLLDMPLKNSLAMRDGVGNVTFSRSTTTTYVDRETGLLKTAGIDEPVFEKEGYRASVASTNYLLWSMQIDTNLSNWNLGPNTQHNGIVPFSGTIDGYQYESITATGYTFVSQAVTTLVVGEEYTLSCWLRSPNPSLVVGGHFRTNASVGESLILGDIVTDEWTRFQIKFTANSTSHAAYCGVDWQVGGIVEMANAQVEKLPFATPYIPTTTTPVTRSADSLTVDTSGNMNGILDPITVMCDVDVIGTNGVYRNIFTSGDIRLMGSSGINDNNSYVFKENSSLTNLVQMPQGKFRYGATYDPLTTTLRMYHNGVLVAEDTSASTSDARASVATLMDGVEGYISNLKIYDKVLTEQEIKLLSGETK